MRRILLGGSGLGLALALAALAHAVEPVCDGVECPSFETDDTADLRVAASSPSSRFPAYSAVPTSRELGAAHLNRTSRDRVWTAGVAHSPMKTF